MKLQFLLILLFQSMLLTGTGTAEERCERLTRTDGPELDIRIEDDLVQGVWNIERPNGTQIIQFEENGIAEVITVNHGSRDVEMRLWTVASDGTEAYLFLHDEDGHMNAYYCRQSCEGILLEDLFSGHQITMEYEPVESHLLFKLKNAQLIGSWRSLRSSAKWQFLENGRFISSDQGKRMGQGFWQLSKDADHIILYYAASNSPESVYRESILKIGELNYEDLSLEKASRCASIPGKELAYFEKI